jgi:hypothetical protein
MARKQRDEWFWQRACAEYRLGGMTLAQVAAKHGVKQCALKYHLYKGKDSPSRREKTSARFLPVKVSDLARPMPIEVATRGGAVVRTAVGADVEYVAKLVRALDA